ncbi:MAG: hypothetical protein HY825_13645 [Acidobacteria bacterium]|nr:hypothetical protein [Acidobacteriota bacterium]
MALPIHLLADSDRIAREWDRPVAEQQRVISDMLRVLVLETVLFAWEVGWWPVVLTCLLRTPDEDRALGGSGLHPAGRAADIRTRDVDPAKVAAVVDRLNARWDYHPGDKKGLQVAVSKPHGTGPHLHLQVHPWTALRED